MSKGRILVVEDELIVGKDIQLTLQAFGYEVPEIVSSGEEAVQAAYRLKPHLIIMDIMIKGGMDGVDAAELVRSQFNIPVVYLTAYSDDETLRRAKLTESYGFISKPFDEKELYVAVEFALYKHQITNKNLENQQWLQLVVQKCPTPLIACDREDKIVLVNEFAVSLVGSSDADLQGKALSEVFENIDAVTGRTTLTLKSSSENGKTVSFKQNILRDANKIPLGRVILIS
ncbi:MAG: putative transcriptional regulatory protein pdtaR [Pseudomonadota bacterium]|jgi:PAS domain S-box-containing protein